jgi:hypothetical protein
MSDLLDKITEELKLFAAADVSVGGLNGLIQINSVQKGDPGWITAYEYPYLMVQTQPINPKSETMGRTGYDVLTHTYALSIMVDATDYFNPDVSGNDAEGPLEDAATLMLLWFRRLANRQLDGLDGVRNVVVGSVDFPADARGEVFARSALLLLTVERQHQHQP